MLRPPNALLKLDRHIPVGPDLNRPQWACHVAANDPLSGLVVGDCHGGEGGHVGAQEGGGLLAQLVLHSTAQQGISWVSTAQ